MGGRATNDSGKSRKRRIYETNICYNELTDREIWLSKRPVKDSEGKPITGTQKQKKRRGGTF